MLSTHLLQTITHQRLLSAIGAGAMALVTASAAHASPPNNSRDRQSDPIAAPGMLRDTGGIRPVGGDLRPVGTDLRPPGGNLRPAGTSGGIRPIEIGSPLANDAAFYRRTRPSTPAYGVTGTTVEPGWNDPPWESSGRSRNPIVPFTSGFASGNGDIAAPASDAGVRAPVRVGQFVIVPSPPVRAAPPNPTVARLTAPRSRRADRGWDDPLPPPPADRAAIRDARPDLRIAARLVSEGRAREAAAALRHIVNQTPTSFAGQRSLFEGDAAAEQLLRDSLAAMRSPGAGRVSDVDARFMAAAFAGALGDQSAAQQSIRDARELGESLPSGKALYRALHSAPPVPAPSEAQP